MSENVPAGNTDVTRQRLAALLGVPAGQVLHYAVVVRAPGGGLLQRFCGMPGNAVQLHAEAIHTLIEHQADFEVAKLAAGCTACGDREVPDES